MLHSEALKIAADCAAITIDRIGSGETLLFVLLVLALARDSEPRQALGIASFKGAYDMEVVLPPLLVYDLA